jgi:queuine tRNA-ribosyltransferase
MNWPKALFTDSGGFQMIRPDFHAKVTNQGITFQSPFDGTKHLITPEKCIEFQVSLGIDIAMVLDHCPEYGVNEDLVKTATKNTNEWANRSITKLKEISQISSKPLPMVFGIVQGGLNKNLREWSAKVITELDFDGYALGGLSIGEPKKTMYKIIESQVPQLPKNTPRYLMGVGSPEDLLESIGLGVDIFDSVFPTRNARHGTIHTTHGNININRAPYSKQFKVIDDYCNCSTCTAGFTRAYLNHLLKNYSILGMRLATIHNLYFIQHLVHTAKERIKDGTYYEFKRDFLTNFLNKK